ncbi:TPA_asm: protein 3 [Cupressus virus 1]|uniref:Protein 3 n=1 Tax=Cupressus virus 1 TaxID=2977965 RepID=A0A9N6YJA2_9RHAB|nr:TPA_asm: protein 3 [Cupressus virus 1]
MSHSFKWNPEYNPITSNTMGSWSKNPSNQAEEEIAELGALCPMDKVHPVFDPSLPMDVPDYTTSWTYSWQMKIKKGVSLINLNDLSFAKKMIKELSRSRKMYKTEIHVLWISHLPPNLYRESVTINLNFEPATEADKKLLSKNTLPAYLYAHNIFYPGHSIELWNSQIPWSIKIDHTEIKVDPKYTMGELHIKIVGTQTEAPQMEQQKKSQLIAMCTLSDPIVGITLDRPRKPSTKWMEGYAKRGVNTRARQEKLMRLMESGVNLEAAALLGKLESIIQHVPDDLLRKCGDPDACKMIEAEVIKAVRGKKKRD